MGEGVDEFKLGSISTVTSRIPSNEVKYVQDEVRVQADIVWFVINALDGRIFVYGSSKGMGEGVEESLIIDTTQKGRLSERWVGLEENSGSQLSACGRHRPQGILVRGWDTLRFRAPPHFGHLPR